MSKWPSFLKSPETGGRIRECDGVRWMPVVEHYKALREGSVLVCQNAAREGPTEIYCDNTTGEFYVIRHPRPKSAASTRNPRVRSNHWWSEIYQNGLDENWTRGGLGSWELRSVNWVKQDCSFVACITYEPSKRDNTELQKTSRCNRQDANE